MTSSASFSNLIDLLSEQLGGQAMYCSDDFFASMHNLVKEGRGKFIPGKYTERGKWMDGWESRRKREFGHDWCILKLGVAGTLDAFDIDTNHFLGNHPPFASIEGCWAPDVDDLDELEALDWIELLGQNPLKPGSQNLFVSGQNLPVTHLRIHIYPDGGVARLRAYGKPWPDWTIGTDDAPFLHRLEKDEVDLAAMRNGAKSLVCSDMFFGDMFGIRLSHILITFGTL